MTRRWEDFGEAEGLFRALRSPKGEQMVLDQNFFVETILPRGMFRKLSDDPVRSPILRGQRRLYG